MSSSCHGDVRLSTALSRVRRTFTVTDMQNKEMSTPAAAAPRAKFPVVLAGFCSFLSLFATQPLLPEFIRIFHGTKASVSLTVSAATMGVAIAAPLIGSV